MEFDPGKVSDFLLLFEEVRGQIAARQGCTHLELCKDASLENVYYTFSIWEKEQDLESYRCSELFEKTWARTKVLFCAKPQAYSLVSN